VLSLRFWTPSRSSRNRSVLPLLPGVLICFLQSKTSQGTEEKRKNTPNFLFPPLSREGALGFQPLAPCLKAQIVLHMLPLLMVWLQTHSFITSVRDTSAFALQAALHYSALYFHMLEEVRCLFFFSCFFQCCPVMLQQRGCNVYLF